MVKAFQRQELRGELQLLPIRLSSLLEMPEDEYRLWVRRLESDPLFRRLASGEGAHRVLRRRPWADARWHIPLEEGGAEAAAPAPRPTGPERVPEQVLALVRRMGREDFERYFLRNDGAIALPDAARACGLTGEEARAVAGFLDGMFLEVEAAGGLPAPPPAAPAWRTVAAVERSGRGFVPAFFSAHYARGLYAIDYDRLAEAKRSGTFSGEDWRRVRELVRQAELINAKQTVLAGLLRLALQVQAEYLRTASPARLMPFTQKQAAERIEASPSAVSRALQGRALRLPWGEERPLAHLFPSRREVAVALVRGLLQREPGLTDAELRDRLRGGWGIKVTVRSVNIYRHLARGQKGQGGKDG